jgi:hypothetical protein
MISKKNVTPYMNARGGNLFSITVPKVHLQIIIKFKIVLAGLRTGWQCVEEENKRRAPSQKI